MNDELAIWESQVGKLTPEQRQHLVEWLQEEQEGWFAREEEWERVQRAMQAAAGLENSEKEKTLSRAH